MTHIDDERTSDMSNPLGTVCAALSFAEFTCNSISYYYFVFHISEIIFYPL